MALPTLSPSMSSFSTRPEDLDFISNLLLEKERPLSTLAIARRLIEEKLDAERRALLERFSNASFYNPAAGFEIGDRLIFPALNFAAGEVTAKRAGSHPDLEPFEVIAVRFEGGDRAREFASCLKSPHALSRDGDDEAQTFPGPALTVDEILESSGGELIKDLEEKLLAAGNLVRLKDEWFVKELLLEVGEANLNLAEAVLDVYAGGPFQTTEILEQFGGLAGPPALQEFSMNYALLHDDRFDEVGPTGAVLWFLRHMEPQEVQTTPLPLRYSRLEHDRRLLDDDMLDLEADIDDELSPLRYAGAEISSATVTLIYPHRRLGTLPLNARLRTFFPTARRSERVYVTLVDARDGEEFTGWIVRKARYVCGLGPFYRKYGLPVGAYIEVSRDEQAGRITLNLDQYRPRKELVRLIAPVNNQLTFREARGTIGAGYDELMVLGTEEPAAVDALFEANREPTRPLVRYIRDALHALSPLSPQGAVHLKTLYSAVNVLRRCPPGPLMTTLVSSAEFDYVGDHYWRSARRERAR